MSKIILCRGIQGSGKTTWAKQWVLEDPEHRVRFNNDDIRNMLGKYWVPSRENLVSDIKKDFMVSAMEFGYGKTKPAKLPSDGLQDAIDWFKKHDIPLFGVNENPTQKDWTSSPKPYAHIYIDDAALGVPLKHDFLSERPYVDWDIVRYYLHVKNVL